jgi:ribosomal protein S18 acetylase RimI-like enzyme
MRRQGIGRMILSFLLDQAKRMHMERVILETTETWAEVIRFYQDQGFRVTHHEAGDVHFALDLKQPGCTNIEPRNSELGTEREHELRSENREA